MGDKWLCSNGHGWSGRCAVVLETAVGVGDEWSCSNGHGQGGRCYVRHTTKDVEGKTI